MASTCCCSGRSNRVMGRDDRRKGKGAMKVEKAPYTYERVASPYHAGEQGPTSNAGGAMQMSSIAPIRKDAGYEPYRHGGGH